MVGRRGCGGVSCPRRATPGLALLAAVSAVCLAASTAVGASSRAAADDPVVTVTFVGTSDNAWTDSLFQPFTKHLEWSLRWSGRLSAMPSSNFDVVYLRGNVSARTPGQPENTCTAKITAAPGVKIFAGGGLTADKRLIVAHGTPPITRDYLRSSNESSEYCNAGAAGYGALYGGTTATEPSVQLVVGSGKTTVSKRFDDTRDGPAGGDRRQKDVYRSTLTLTIGAAQSPPAGAPTTPPLVKALARLQLIESIGVAIYPCLTTAEGIAVIGGGGVTLGPIVGSTLIAVFKPSCMRAINAIKDFAEAYDDPPDPHYQQVVVVRRGAAPRAGLPDCAAVAASAQAFCRRLTAAASAWLAQMQRVSDLATALATTVRRETAAGAAGDKAALARQQKAGLALRTPVLTARAAERSVGKALAGVLRGAGFTAKLTSAQVSSATAYLLQRLTSSGARVPTVKEVAAAQLAARPRDGLALLDGSGR